VNIGQVVSEINKKTADFKGMQVPVKVTVDTVTKAFSISIGTPPASALIKKESKIEKGSGRAKDEHVADLAIEQIIKIAKMKQDSMLGKNMKACVKEVIGTCNSMGVMVEGVHAKEALKLVNEGRFDKEITAGKTELSEEELRQLEEERKKMQEEIKEKYAEFEAKGKEILALMAGKEPKEIKAKLKEAGLPDEMISKLLPTESGATGAKAPGAADKGAEPKKTEPKK
jgi:large subunit ribosomal protein L11